MNRFFYRKIFLFKFLSIVQVCFRNFAFFYIIIVHLNLFIKIKNNLFKIVYIFSEMSEKTEDLSKLSTKELGRLIKSVVSSSKKV